MPSATSEAELDPLTLQDWRRRVFELYGAARREADAEIGWRRWRSGRDALFEHHPATPLPEEARARFGGLPLQAYDPSARVLAEVVHREQRELEIAASDGLPYRFTHFASAHFTLAGDALMLELYWLRAYGGGLFLPFTDATSSATTYRGGRYLLDTVKGADLGLEDGRLVLDFNFAYNPSCSYDPRWSCPLPHAQNRLPAPVTVGELAPAIP